MSGLDWLAAQATAREAAGLRRRLHPRRAAADGCLDLAGNDYLGLAGDPRVIEAGVAALRTWGGGSTGSRLVTGSTALHAELEEALAAHLRSEAALVFSSGYLANLAAVTALAGRGDLVVSDARVHASLVDAIRLSRARVVVTPHREVAAVERALAGRSEARALVVTDAVFSVDGELAPLSPLAEVCRRHGAVLLVDEAHAVGVVGPGGRGAIVAAGLDRSPDVVRTATLSKALASQGGAVLASRAVVDHLVDTGRSFIFDTGLAPACAGVALRALQVLTDEPGLAGQVRRRATQLADAAADAGLPVSRPAAGVASVRIGDPERALAAAAACAEAGVRLGCFRPPSVPDGISRLRMTARADLTEADVRRAAAALRALTTGGAG